jgi:hypothetical protein
MNTYFANLPLWSTTARCFSEEAVPSVATDASSLCKHLDHCKVPNRQIFAMHCAAEMMHGFVLGRFVTTLVVVFILIGSYFLVV